MLSQVLTIGVAYTYSETETLDPKTISKEKECEPAEHTPTKQIGCGPIRSTWAMLYCYHSGAYQGANLDYLSLNATHIAWARESVVRDRSNNGPKLLARTFDFTPIKSNRLLHNLCLHDHNPIDSDISRHSIILR